MDEITTQGTNSKDTPKTIGDKAGPGPGLTGLGKRKDITTGLYVENFTSHSLAATEVEKITKKKRKAEPTQSQSVRAIPLMCH